MPTAQEVEGNGLEQSDEDKTKGIYKEDRPMPFSDWTVATNYIMGGSDWTLGKIF